MVRLIGTTSSGVSKFDGTIWTAYTTADGLAGNYVTAIVIDSLGNIWFSTFGGVTVFDGTTWITYTTADEWGDNYLFPLAIDSADNKWVGTYGGGVYVLLGEGKLVNHIYVPLVMTD